MAVSARGFVQLPREEQYWLLEATVPSCCISESACVGEPDEDGLCLVDIEVDKGRVKKVVEADASRCHVEEGATVVYLNGSMCWPTMVDLHTHIDKSHTFERSRNQTGTLTGADRSTCQDSKFWSLEDVLRRMDFSIQCAYIYGTSALRTHLINITDKQQELTWAAFSQLRSKWAGKVEIQGVALVLLSFFRDLEKSRKLVKLVEENGGVLGAAVSCTETGGLEEDDLTTCSADRGQLLERIFSLARESDLDLDFHVDENGNEASRGLRDICKMTIKYNYHGRVVCGHCCSLAHQSQEDLQETLVLARLAGVTIVSLPLVNEWLQDRSHCGQKTPRWRGVTALLELKEAGVKTALASDNTRDQFYAYGDLDLLDVFTQSVRIGHLDCPHSDWPCSITSVPANAMGLEAHGRIAVGLGVDFILFNARKYSELLSRPQHDRIVLRDGQPIERALPSYKDLDPCQPENLLGPARFIREPSHCKVNQQSFPNTWGHISWKWAQDGLLGSDSNIPFGDEVKGMHMEGVRALVIIQGPLALHITGKQSWSSIMVDVVKMGIIGAMIALLALQWIS